MDRDAAVVTEDDARRIAARVLQHADAHTGVEVVLHSARHAVTRFANNAIHQNVEDIDHTVAVRVVADGRSASATTNAVDDAALDAVVGRARALARVLPHDPGTPPLSAPQAMRPLDGVAPATLQATPADRARCASRMIDRAIEADLTAAGTCVTDVTASVVANSRGLWRYHVDTSAGITLTAYGSDSSGWGEHQARDFEQLAADDLARRVVEKARRGRDPIDLPAGEYDVVLEPNAVAELVAFLGWLGFGAQSYDEGRSFMSGRIGETITGEAITIVDDVRDARAVGAPFDVEGVARERVTFIDRGRARGIVHDTRTATRAGCASTGHALPQPNPLGPIPLNLVVAEGTASLDALIASTRRGILVTRFWYNRVVDPLRTIITGMTRDGTFLIEDGVVTRGVKNMRYNESVLDVLSRAEEIGANAVLTSGVVAPAMRVRGFRFTGVTRF